MYCDPSGMGVQEQRVVLMLLSFGFVGYIDEYLPATLFTPLLGALGDIFYVFARIDFDKAIDGLVGVYGNLSKLNWWISGLSGRTGLTPDEIGFFLNTGELMENLRVYGAPIMLAANDFLQSMKGFGASLFKDFYQPLPEFDTGAAQDMFELLGRLDLAAATNAIKNFVSDRGWSIPINWLAFLLDGTKPILS